MVAHTVWQAGRFRVDLQQPKIMGIVNLTPDSFSDGGSYTDLQTALRHAEEMLGYGADILDIGGESTRPGAAEISLDEEWRRVEPLLRELSTWNVPISLDTRHTPIMRRALDGGLADIINDVQALEDEGAVELLANSDSIGICLMHMKGKPKTMQQSPHYDDIAAEVAAYLCGRADVCKKAGIATDRLLLDLGFGFGKTLQHNILLMKHSAQIAERCDLPLLAGVSRKRMIGELTRREVPSERVAGSVAAALASVQYGAKVVRVHDVKETADALKVWQALM
ncbi:MAG: dihydropteroate synthase [Neisseria sp.]|nr:dihydropteroate synthase [Neisseria sp.]